jgi:hypothetical protein
MKFSGPAPAFVNFFFKDLITEQHGPHVVELHGSRREAGRKIQRQAGAWCTRGRREATSPNKKQRGEMAAR